MLVMRKQCISAGVSMRRPGMCSNAFCNGFLSCAVALPCTRSFVRLLKKALAGLRDFTMATDVRMAGEGLALGHAFSTYNLSHMYDKASLLHPTGVQAVEREQSQ